MACSKSGAIIYTSSPDVFNLCHTFQLVDPSQFCAHHPTTPSCLWDCNVSLIVCCHSNSAGVASFYPAVNDNPDTEVRQVNNLAENLRSMINTAKLLDVSNVRTQPKARLRAAEQVCTTQTAALPC